VPHARQQCVLSDESSTNEDANDRARHATARRRLGGGRTALHAARTGKWDEDVNDSDVRRDEALHQNRQSLRARLSIYTILATAGVASMGNNLTAIAIPWFVLVTTGSAARTGLVAVAGLLPVVISGIIGGAFVDRVGFKRASIISDIASGITVALIPTLYLLDLLAFWHLLALAFVGALLDVPGMSARRAMMPKLAGQVGMPLERVNAGYQLALFGSSVAGPLLAGVLIASIGAASVLYVNTATFAISAFLVAVGVHYPRALTQVQEAGRTVPHVGAARRSTVFSEALDGIRFLFHDQLLRAIVLVSIVANFLFSPLFSVIFPVFAKRTYDDPRALGLLVASFGAGSVISSIGYAAFGPTLRRYAVFVGGAMLASGGLWMLPWAPNLPVSLAAGFVVGFAVAPINALAMVALQERVPEQMLGRAMGAVIALSQLAAPAGVLAAGLTVEWLGVRAAMVAIAFCFMLLIAWSVINPAFRLLDRQTDDTSGASGREAQLVASSRRGGHP
jgi:MFS family permease